MKRVLFLTGLCLAFVSAMPVHAATVMTTWHGSNIYGEGSNAHPYGLRLDGFFDNHPDHEVVFNLDSVYLDLYSDGSLNMRGYVSVCDFNKTGSPGIYASTWDLNIAFTEMTDLSSVSDPNPEFTYYMIAPQGREMVNQADANDFADLWTFPTNFAKPFQLGIGANQHTARFGGTGWVSYEHNDNGTIYGLQDVYLPASDIVMDLEIEPQPTPEPGTLALLGLGLAAGAARLRRRKI